MKTFSLLFITLLTWQPTQALPDSCEFIRQGLAQLPPQGGVFLIPAGTYLCTRPIVMDRSHQTLRGEGDVWLRLADSANAPVIVMGDLTTPPSVVEDLEIANLKIDGNRIHQTMECWGGPCESSPHAFIRNNGVSVRGLRHSRIKNIQVTSARSGGIVTEKGCEDLLIDGLISLDNEFDGFAGYETSGALITNTRLAFNQAAGISIDIRFNKNSFKNVIIEHNGDVGIFMRDSNENLFEKVSIEDSGNHGIFLSQAEDEASCANNNEFSNLTVRRSFHSGFRLNSACPGNRLTGSALFEKNREDCLSEDPSAHLDIQGSLQCVH